MNRLPGLRRWVFLLLLVATAVSGQDLINSLLDQGMRHYAQQNWAAAADYLGQVCDMAPDHHTARYYLVYSLLMMKKYPAALKEASTLVERQPGVPQYVQLRDQVQQAMAATLAAQTGPGAPAGTRRPGVPPKEVVLGGYEPLKGKTLEEPKMPTGPRPGKPTPAKPPTPLEQAISYLDGGDYAEATRLLDDLLKKEPKNAKVLHHRGVVELNQRLYPAAVSWFKKAVEADPKSFETWFLLGEIAAREGRLKDAEDAFQKAVAIKQDVFALVNLGDVLRRQGQPKKALEIYEKVIKLDSNVLEAKINLAEAQLDLGRIDDATVLINEVLTANPSNGQAHFVKGKLLYRSDLLDDAISEIKLALNTASDNAEYQLFLGKVLLKAFRTGEASERGAAVLRDNPQSFEARLLLAEAMLMEGQTGDAEEHVNQAEKIRSSPELARLRALIARRNGDNDKAKTFFQTYLSQDPDNGYAYLEYGDMLEKSGDIPSALEVYRLIKTRFAGTQFADNAEIRLAALGGSAAGNEPALPGGGYTPPPIAKPPAKPGKVRY